jgi:ATP-dependent DNA ligase
MTGYIFPCKPNPLHPSSPYFDEIDDDVRWIAEIKKNGIRCLPQSGETITLWTRHKTTVDNPLKPLREALKALPEGTLLDGELLDYKAGGSPGRLFLFDIIYLKGKPLFGSPLEERHRILESVVEDVPGVVEILKQVRVGKKHLFHSLQKDEDEGIVLKRLDSLYLISHTRCLQNPHWLKVRRKEL